VIKGCRAAAPLRAWCIENISQMLPVRDVESAEHAASPASSLSRAITKPDVTGTLLQIVRRIVYPRHTAALVRCLCAKKPDRKSAHDAELKFCADILPGDFLNYGYYDDPATPADEISLRDIQRAQVRYGQLLVEQIRDKDRAVLDAGCGMGGLLNLLVTQGFKPTALTPNHSQLEHIRARHRQLPLIEGKFDPSTMRQFAGQFGTVVTSESFQYMKLVPGMQTIQRVLAPGGRWILCDYFRIAETRRRSGHHWTDFNRALTEQGWKIVLERDITPHVLPTLRYLHMLGGRVGNAAAEFAVGKLRRKRPALHFILQDAVAGWRAYISDQVRTVDPEIFVREKKYMLMVMERAESRSFLER
jgi:SAM-dependent methyltransferase